MRTFISVGILALFATSGLLRAAEILPARPASHVLDQARVLSPEAAARMSTALQEAARTDDVQVFVITVLATETGKLDQLGASLTNAWTGGAVGAVLVFDDRSGWVTIGTSDEADRRFSPLVLNMVLREPLMAGRRKGLSPVKLEQAAYSVANVLRSLKAGAERKSRKQLIENLAMGVLVLVVAVLCVVSARGKLDPPEE